MNAVTPAYDRTGPSYRWIRTPLSAVAFYSAIALPALYLPLIISGIESTEGLLLFLGLFGLHVTALVGGRAHGR